MNISFILNGKKVALQTDPLRTLLAVLREDFCLTGTKEGCGKGECGACTILLDGVVMRACLLYAGQAQGRSVTTVEALGSARSPHPIQEAFVDAGAVQCGYCTPGMVLATQSLLAEHPSPTEAAIRDALDGNLCRCTGYVKILDAVKLAATRQSEGGPR